MTLPERSVNFVRDGRYVLFDSLAELLQFLAYLFVLLREFAQLRADVGSGVRRVSTQIADGSRELHGDLRNTLGSEHDYSDDESKRDLERAYPEYAHDFIRGFGTISFAFMTTDHYKTSETPATGRG